MTLKFLRSKHVWVNSLYYYSSTYALKPYSVLAVHYRDTIARPIYCKVRALNICGGGGNCEPILYAHSHWIYTYMLYEVQVLIITSLFIDREL